MATYLLNAFSTTMLLNGGVAKFINLEDAQKAREFLPGNLVSAVGHQGTADVFSVLLDVPVEPRRVQIVLKPGDYAVIGQINARLPEGKILNTAELEEFPIRWVLVTVKETKNA